MKRLFYFFLLIPISMFAKDPQVYFSVVGRKVLTVVGNDIYVNGLYIGNGSGNNWKREGWKNIGINGIEIDSKSDGKVIYTACGNGVIRSNDFGKNWKILTNWDVTEVQKVKLDPQNSAIIYAATAFGIWKSTDSGLNWINKNNGLKPVNQTFIASIEISPNGTIYVGCADGVLCSKDGAESWQQIGLSGKEIHEIKISPSDDNLMACVTEDHGVYLSNDQGKNWKQINYGLKSMTFYTIAFDPKNKGVIYCGGYKTGIYKTFNYGEKWIQMQNDITDKDVKTIVVYHENPDVIFTGLLNFGLYKSSNGGNTFSITGEPDGRIGSILLR